MAHGHYFVRCEAVGQPPHVVRAWRFAPKGRVRGLNGSRVRGAVKVDPRAQDFFRTVIEERKQLKTRLDLDTAERERLDGFLKVIANATSYGIFAEMNRQEGKPEIERSSHGLDRFTYLDDTPEKPGKFFFSPLAALIAGGARG